MRGAAHLLQVYELQIKGENVSHQLPWYAYSKALMKVYNKTCKSVRAYAQQLPKWSAKIQTGLDDRIIRLRIGDVSGDRGTLFHYHCWLWRLVLSLSRGVLHPPHRPSEAGNHGLTAECGLLAFKCSHRTNFKWWSRSSTKQLCDSRPAAIESICNKSNTVLNL